MNAFAHMAGDNLLIDTCSWAVLSSINEDSKYNKSESYATAVTLNCFAASPRSQWIRLFPTAKVESSRMFFLPHDATVGIRDKITHNSIAYRVIDIQDWDGAAFLALCERTDGA